MCPPTMVSSGKVSATSSRYGIGRPVSDGMSGPVWPTCVQNGIPSSMHFAVERVIEPVIGRELPKPRDHAQRFEAEIADGTFQLLHGLDRAREIDGGNAIEAAWVAARELSDFVVGEDPLTGSAPCAEHHRLDPGFVHRGHRLVGAHTALEDGTVRLREESLDLGDPQAQLREGGLCPRVDQLGFGPTLGHVRSPRTRS